jgi:hypothetical protein
LCHLNFRPGSFFFSPMTSEFSFVVLDNPASTRVVLRVKRISPDSFEVFAVSSGLLSYHGVVSYATLTSETWMRNAESLALKLGKASWSDAVADALSGRPGCPFEYSASPVLSPQSLNIGIYSNVIDPATGKTSLRRLLSANLLATQSPAPEQTWELLATSARMAAVFEAAAAHANEQLNAALLRAAELSATVAQQAVDSAHAEAAAIGRAADALRIKQERIADGERRVELLEDEVIPIASR